MLKAKQALCFFGFLLCIQNCQISHGSSVLYVTPSSVIEEEHRIIPRTEEDGLKKKRNAPEVLFVTPVSVSKEVNSLRKSRSPKKPSPPSTSYGTPFHEFYDEPPSSYGAPYHHEEEEEEDHDEEEEEEMTEAPPTEPPPEEPSGYDYSPPKEKVIVNKDIYFYKPGPDFTEPPPTSKPIKLPPPRKNYKILFVKAPTFVSAPQIVPVVPQVEDKTLLYVLVKKPEEQPEIVVPTPAPTKPSPPEVYYVKYDTKKEKVEEPKPSYGPPPPSTSYGASRNDGGDKAKGKSKKSKRSQVRKGRSSDGKHVQGFVPYVHRRRAYE